MNVVRLWGDPFADDAAGDNLRAFLRLAGSSGLRIGICLSAVQLGDRGRRRHGANTVELSDGVHRLPVATDLPAAELQPILAAAARALPSTAPVLVFAADPLAAAQLAALEWPRACRLLKVAPATTPAELVARVRSELRWAGTEDPEVGIDERELQPWLQLPPPQGELMLHLGSADPADGSDVAVRVFAQRFAAQGCRLRVLLPDGEATAVLQMAAAAAAPAGVDALAAIEFVVSAPTPALLVDVAFAIQPLRLLPAPQRLLPLLASGRPLCLSRFDAVAALLPAPGLCEPVGGRWLPAENGAPAAFEPDPRALARAIERLRQPAHAAGIAARARQHVLQELTNDRPAAPPPVPLAIGCSGPSRPQVVLEAPLLETSSTAEYTLATARELHRRGEVELTLSPTLPFHRDLDGLRARAPELLPLLRRPPACADLWLASGWPLRSARPPARCFAVRVDWEYGALPVELLPVVGQEADVVVVHSAHVLRAVRAAGRPVEQVRVIPHGVDGELFHPAAPPLASVLEWKRGRPAVLFVGGLIWRKGIDLFLRAVLDAAAAAPPFAVVVKGLGSDQHYEGYHLRELVQRLQRLPGAPPLLLLEDDLSRAELAGLFRACDLLLHPYRGEGFGMPVLEARACGLPVMVTRGGATDDFAVGAGVVPIPAGRRTLDLPEVCVSQPWVLEPDGAACGKLLAQSLGELPRLQAAAQREAAAILQECRWENAAAAIEALAREAVARRAGRGEAAQPALQLV